MADTISTYYSKFIADMDGFLSPMKDAEKQANQVEKALKPLTNAAADVGKAMVGIGASITAVGVPFALMSKSAIDNAEALHDMAIRTGATVETLSALQAAAKVNGVAMEDLEKAFKQSSKAFEDASTGGSAAQKTLEKLGLSVQTLTAMNPDERFFAISKSLAAIQDPGLRAGVAMEIFGKSGTNMTTILQDLAKGQVQFTAETEKFTTLITTAGADSADKFNDSLTHIGSAFSGIFNVIANSGILDYLSEFIDYIAQVTAEFVNAHPWITSVGVALGLLAAVIGPVIVVLGGLLIGAGALVPVLTGIAAVAATVGAPLIAIGTALVAATVAVVAAGIAVVTFISTNEDLRAAVSNAWKEISDAFSRAKDALIPVLQRVSDAMEDLWKRISPGLSTQFEHLVDILSYLIRDFANLVSTIVDGFTLVLNVTNKVATAFGMTSSKTSEFSDVVAKHSTVMDKAVGLWGEGNAALRSQIPLMDAANKLFEEAKKKADDFAKAVKGITESVTGSATKTAELTAAVKLLEAAHVPTEAIVKALGSQLEAEAGYAAASGKAMNDTLAPLYAAKEAHDKLKETTEALKKAQDEAAAGQKKLLENLASLSPAIQEGTRQMISMINGGFTPMNEEVAKLHDLLPVVTRAQIDYTEAMKASGEQAGLTGVEELAAQVEIQGAITSTLQADKDAAKARKEVHKDAAQTMQQAWATAIGTVNADFAKGITAMLFKGGDFGDKMVGIAKAFGDQMIGVAKKTAEGMLQAFLAGLLNPLTNELVSLGKQLSDFLTKAITGAAGGGGVTGSIVSQGTSAGAGTITQTGGLSGVGGAIGSALTNPWVLAGAGVAAGVTAWLKSQAHWEANTVVQNIENPFWQAWGQILPTDNLAALAALPADQAKQIYANLDAMNQNYLALVNEYSKGGSDEYRVSQQSLANTQSHVMAVENALNQAINSGSATSMTSGIDMNVGTSGNDAYRNLLGLDQQTYDRLFPPPPQAAEGGYVKETGAVIVHQGEHITPKGQASITLNFNIGTLSGGRQGYEELMNMLRNNTGGAKTRLLRELSLA